MRDSEPKIRRAIEDDDVCKTPEDFSPEHAVCLMLLNGALRFRYELGGEVPDTRLVVDCSDVFIWGCSEEEELPFSEIEKLYRLWRKDLAWGHAVWCMIQRREMPQQPVEEAIRDDAIWDIDALRREHDLRPNSYDGLNLVSAQRKYGVYAAWATECGRCPRPFAAHWWDGWDEFVAQHPEWHVKAWRAEDDRLSNEWLRKNGFPWTVVPSD